MRDKNNSTLINSFQILENEADKLILDAPPLSLENEALNLFLTGHLKELEDINIVVFVLLNVLMN